MRSFALVYVGILMSVFLVVIMCLLTTKSSYADILRSSLDDAMYYAVTMLQSDRLSLTYDDVYTSDGTGNMVSAQNVESIGGISFKDADGHAWYPGSLVDDEFNTYTDEALKQDFIGYLASRLDSRVTDIEVEFYGADSKNGVISAQVIAYFEYPTGQRDKVTTYKTVILDKEVK